MSHFTVLVIGENPEKQLAPYQENNMGDCPGEYMEFHDQEDELFNEYVNDGTEKIVMPDGRLLSPWDEEFRVDGSIGTTFGRNPSHQPPEGLERKEIPFADLYKSFEEFVEDWHGNKGRDAEKGKYGYWENPNAKWDWYQLGGRWTGFFKLHLQLEAVVGSPGLMTSPALPGYADQAKKADIDFLAMINEAELQAKEKWEMIENAFGGEIPKVMTWNRMRELEMNKERSIDEIRTAYWSQPGTAKLKEMRGRDDLPEDVKQWAIFGSLDDMQVGKEQYIAKAGDSAISTFAVIKDGKWYEKGSMGWWGIVSDENEQLEWNAKVRELLEGLDSSVLLSIYDCHI